MRRLVALLLLTSCAGAPEPGRPVTVVPDEVGAVDRALVVGAWTCRALDAPAGAPNIAQTMQFDVDGRARSQALIDMSANGLPARYEMISTWDWAVTGERLSAANPQTKTRATDDGAASGMLAGLTQIVMSGVGSSTQPGTVDVLRLDREQLVMRSAGVEDAPVISCRRGGA